MAHPSSSSDKLLASGKWAFGLGIVACGIACAAPLFVGLLGVGVASAAAFRGGMESVAVVLSVGGLALIGAKFVKQRLRARRSVREGELCGCEASCAVAPGEETPSNTGRPIACTLDGESVRRRLGELRPVFKGAFVQGERESNQVRWRFRSVPGLETDLGALAERARSCCSFFEFRVFDKQAEIWWECHAEPAAEPVMEEVFKLPDRLADRDSWPDERLLGAASAAFRKAGGRFAAGAG